MSSTSMVKDASTPTCSLLACVVQASCEEWSGRLEVRLGGSSLGHVVFVRGRIAWAKSNDQTENLASLLWRLSHITNEQLNEVSKLYYKHQGKRPIGAILEERGFLSKIVLRRCLMLHTRFALAGLLAYPEALVDLVPEEIASDETTLFNPEEVLPFPVATGFARDWVGGIQDDDHWRQVSAQSDLLRPLFALPGYLAAAVISSHGSVLVAHRQRMELQPQILGVLLASQAESATDLTVSAGLGTVNGVFLECAQGRLAARWIDPEHTFIVTVLTLDSCGPGAAFEGLSQICATLRGWLTTVCTAGADSAARERPGMAGASEAQPGTPVAGADPHHASG